MLWDIIYVYFFSLLYEIDIKKYSDIRYQRYRYTITKKCKHKFCIPLEC